MQHTSKRCEHKGVGVSRELAVAVAVAGVVVSRVAGVGVSRELEAAVACSCDCNSAAPQQLQQRMPQQKHATTPTASLGSVN